MDEMAKLTPGDGILMKGFKRRFVDDNWDVPLQLSFAGPKRQGHHLMLYLGVFGPDAALTTDARLNAIGWVYDPKRAADEFEKNKEK